MSVYMLLWCSRVWLPNTGSEKFFKINALRLCGWLETCNLIVKCLAFLNQAMCFNSKQSCDCVKFHDQNYILPAPHTGSCYIRCSPITHYTYSIITCMCVSKIWALHNWFSIQYYFNTWTYNHHCIAVSSVVGVWDINKHDRFAHLMLGPQEWVGSRVKSQLSHAVL